MNITDTDPAAQRLVPIVGAFHPLDDRVLVKRLDDEPPSSPVIVPEVAATLSKKGMVVAAGPGKRDSEGFRRPLDVKPGDFIMFGRYTDFDDGNLVIIQEADIVGILT